MVASLKRKPAWGCCAAVSSIRRTFDDNQKSSWSARKIHSPRQSAMALAKFSVEPSRCALISKTDRQRNRAHESADDVQRFVRGAIVANHQLIRRPLLGSDAPELFAQHRSTVERT